MSPRRNSILWRRRKRKVPSRRLFLEQLESRRLLAVQPVGDEFLVNQSTSGNQYTTPGGASVGSAANGDSVVVFNGRGPQDRTGVFGQRLAASGQTIGDQFTVNQTRFGWQDKASVSVAENGEFVVAWNSIGPGNAMGVFARRFCADGTPVGEEIQVKQSRFDLRHEPAVAIKPDGSFVVAWEGRGQGDVLGVLVRQFDANGNASTPELLANTTIQGAQRHATIAVAPDGAFAVAWNGAGTGDKNGIFMRRFHPTGDPLGNEVRVNTTTRGQQSAPAIASDGEGNFVVAWKGEGPGDQAGIFLQRFSAAGLPLGPEQPVNSTTLHEQSDPAIAAARDGALVVTWSSHQQDGSRESVIAQQFDAVGQKVDDERLVNTTTLGAQQASSVALQDNGDFLVTWSGRGVGDSRGVFASRYASERVNDTTPPTIIVALASDTGSSDSDGVTSDPALLGTVVDESVIASLTLAIPELSLGPFEMVHELDPADGSFAWDRAALEAALGTTLDDGSYTLQFQAADAHGNQAAPVSLAVTLDTSAPSAPANLDLLPTSDTGLSDSDNVTADATPTFSVEAEAGSLVKLLANGALVGQAIAHSTVEITTDQLASGLYDMTATATDRAGNASSASATLPLEIRTADVTAPAFDLAAGTDSVPMGDLATTVEIVTFVGQTDPHMNVELLELNQRVTADATGVFTLLGVPLELGDNTFSIEASDIAGNSAQFSRTITRLPAPDSIVLTESDRFVTEHRETIALGQVQGTRTIRFEIAADFDTSAASGAVEDAFLVYLVDSQDATRTLLDRGTNGTALFMLAGDRVERAPGIVRFDGTTVEIDVTSLSELQTGMLVFQLLGSDNDHGTQVEITNLTNTLDPLGVAAGLFPVDDYLATRGGAVDLTSFSLSPDLQPLLSNIRFAASTGRYTAELRIVNHGAAIGRHAVVRFPGLPAGVTLLAASGTDSHAAPYINMQTAIPRGGLVHAAASDGILIEFDNAQWLRFLLTPQVLVGPLNHAPTLAPIESLTMAPGEVVEIALGISDPDGDPLTTEITSAQGVLPARLLAGGVLRFAPAPNELGSYDLTVTVSDGVLPTQQSFQLVVAEDPEQVTRISGVVLDTDGAPLAGVPISLSRLVTMTDSEGRFEIRLPSTLLPTESFDLEVPAGDPYFDPFGTGVATIDFRRARFDLSTGTDADNPRRHPNLVSSFLDASTVYGSDDSRALALRTGSGGRLKSSDGPDGELLPLNNAAYFPNGPLENDSAGTADPSTLFVAGDVRASENPALAAIHTLFVREHNRQADTIAAANPLLSDEQIYQLARAKVIALLQHITYQEYLPVLLGSGAIPDYAGYDANVEPETGPFFTTAAFRIGHSQMVSQLLRLDANGDESAGGHLSLREAFFTSVPLQAEGIDTLLRGLLAQPAQATDLQVVDELRNFLFGPPGSGGMDLPAMTVQRGREMGLPSYAQARVDFGLSPVNDFSDITSNVAVQAALRDLYGTVDNIDPFVGGLAEEPVPGALVGPLFQQAIARQFRNARDGDRFWYENAQFTQSELDEIRATTLAELIARNTGVTGLAGNLFTSGTPASGPLAGGSASLRPVAEFRSLDGSGNNTVNSQAGAAGSQLRIDASLHYADEVSAPNGGDRPAARAVSNAMFAQSGSAADATGFNALGIFWGQFLSHDLALTPTGTSDTLKIHGDGLHLPDKEYPFVAEKLNLLLEREIFENASNDIARPIYLPAIDVANAVTVDPAHTTTVTTTAIPHAALTIAANTLTSRDGRLYAGQISITEVPRDLTPAALPTNALPDIVVTIQPAEMIFTTPAPLTLPNRAGYPVGETFDLMSINPVTGEFDIVGTGRATGTQIETIDGGVRNSSWHFFRRQPPELVVDPQTLPANERDGCHCECSECKAKVDTDSHVELHSGAYIEHHDLVGYQSQGQTRSWQLTYDSKRVSPRPIVHFGYENVQWAPGRRLGASITWAGVGTTGGAVAGTSSSTPTFQHYWSIPEDGNFEAALQANMQNVPSGSYNILLRSGLVQYVAGQAFGVSNVAAIPVEVINSTGSEFGAGWGLAGVQEIAVNGHDSVLIIDGDGSELRFANNTSASRFYQGVPYAQHGFESPPGDFSTLEFVAADASTPARFIRTFRDQTVYVYRVTHSDTDNGRQVPRQAKLESIRDRNGNETRFEYNTASRLTKIIDPVGLETVFHYVGSRITSIDGPGGRTTSLEYDAAGNLIRIGDPDGTQRQFEYNQHHQLTAELTKRGFRESVVYDRYGRVTKTVRRDGTEFHIAPLQTQQMIRYSLTTDHAAPPPAKGPSLASRGVYAATQLAGVVQTSSSTLGATHWLDPSGRTYQSLVDRDGQEILRTDSEGLVAANERSADNQIVRSVSGRGFVTLYEYDERGNLLSISDDETLSDKTVEYLFDSGFDTAGRVPESDGGAPLSTIAYFGEAPGPFVSEEVFGTQRQVYAFSANQGLSLTTTDLIPADNYAIELVFRFEEVAGTRHLFDFNDRRGGAPPLVVIDGQLGFSSSPARRGGSIVAGEYVHVVLTRASETDEVVGYVDGEEVFRFIDIERYLTITSYDLLSFFVELRAPFNNGHVSPGAAALIRVYENPLTPGQVQRLSDDPFGVDFSGLDKTVFSYDPVFNQRTRMTDQLGRQTFYEIDPTNGNLLSVTRVVGQPDSQSSETDDVVTRYTYLASGLVDTMTDPLGRVTDFDYDEFERLVRTTYAAGTVDEAVSLFEYDLAGNLAATVDENSNRTEYEYDALNRLTRITEPDPDGPADPELSTGLLASPITEFTYDTHGNLLQQIDPLGNTTSHTYDVLDRRIASTDALNQVVRYNYDSSSNVVSKIDRLGRRTQLVYDTRNRLVEVIDPLGNRERLAYDRDDNVIRRTDKNGHETFYQYNARNLLIQTTDALGGVSRWRYDRANQLVQQSDQLDRTTEYEYDELDRRIKTIAPDPDGPVTQQGIAAEYLVSGNLDEKSGGTTLDVLGAAGQFASEQVLGANRDVYQFTRGNGLQLTTTDIIPADQYSIEMVFRFDSIFGYKRVLDFKGLSTDTGLYVQDGQLRFYSHPGSGGSILAGQYVHLILTRAANGTLKGYVNGQLAFEAVDFARLGVIDNADDRLTLFVDDGNEESDGALALLRLYATPLTEDQIDSLAADPFAEEFPLPTVTTGLAESPVTRFVYDKADQLLQVIDPLGNVTTNVYDNRDRLVQRIAPDPDGTGPLLSPVTNFTYDDGGRLTSVSDPLNRVTTYAYDGLDQLIQEFAPDPDGAGPDDAPVTSYTYDAVNNLVSTTDALGNTTRFEYDSLYRRTRLIQPDPDENGPDGHPITAFAYDAAGQLLRVSDPLGRTTRYEYDLLGRRTRETLPDPDGPGPLTAPTTSYTYDPVGNERSMIDPLGNVTEYEYDNLYRLTRRIDEDLDGAGPLVNPVTTFTYDLVGNLLSLTDPVGNITTYDYDGLNRRTAETIDLGSEGLKTRSYRYDSLNNLLASTDRNGRVIEYIYDGLYRNVEERWLDDQNQVVHSIHFDYDIASQLLMAEDVTVGSRYDYRYDDLGRMNQTHVDHGGLAVVLDVAYDAASLRTQLLASVAGVADFANEYVYDDLLRVSSQLQHGRAGGATIAPKRVDYTYNADDQFTAITRYGSLAADPVAEVATTAYRYDGIDRLTGLDHTHAATSLHALGFEFDAAHRITRIETSLDGPSDFGYDNVHQLTSADHASQSDESYLYDENGNRLAVATSGSPVAWQTGPYNRLVSDGVFDYEYDAEGNRTKRTEIATGAITEYVWDHRNRLVRVTERLGDQGPATKVVAHTYDVFNRWIAHEVDADGDGPQPSVTTRFIYDGSEIILRFDGAGNVTHRYLWGAAVDQILADENALGEVLWPLSDHQGTVRDLVDADGTVVNHITYDSYGKVSRETVAAIDHLFGYTGRPFDESTGLQNNLNRWYDAQAGRWISEDPIGFNGGDANLSRYVGNEVTTATDPSGLIEPTMVPTYRGFGGGFYNPMSTQSLGDPRGRYDIQRRDDINAIDNATGLLPYLSDGRDIAEWVTGRDLVRNVKLTPCEQFATGVGIFIPVLGATYFRDGLKLIKGGDRVEDVADDFVEISIDASEAIGKDVVPDVRTGAGYGVNDPPVRIQGTWTDNDLKQALLGHPPRGLGSPDLHHANQMPGSGIHEVLPREHRGNTALHPNRFNQGVGPEMRAQDRQLHWWYRAREQGADRRLPGWIYDSD